MKISENKNQLIFHSSDFNGDFEFRVQKDGSQFQLETEILNDGFGGDLSFADTNYEEIAMMRDLLNKVLEPFEQRNNEKR